MKRMDRTRDYFAGRLSAGEMKKKLKTGSERSAQELVSLIQFDEFGRNLLSGLAPPEGAAERLSQRIISADTWMDQATQAREASPSRKWLGKLTPAFDVAGHGLPARQKPKRKPKPKKKPRKLAKSRGKARKRSRKPPRRK